MSRSPRRCVAAMAMLPLLVLSSTDAHAQEGWGTTPELLSGIVSTGGAIYAPKVDVDALGNAVALWTDRGPTVIGTGSVVRTSRYLRATAQWSAPLTLSKGERTALAEDVAVDAAGNALAVWTTNPISTAFLINVARYDAASDTWTAVPMAPGGFVRTMAVAMSQSGHAGVCWDVDTSTGGVHCRYYAPGTGWAAVELVSTPTSTFGDVAIDEAGGLRVVWTDADTVLAARRDPGTGQWAITPLAIGLALPNLATPRVAVNAAGDAAATWVRDRSIEAARSVTGGSGWSAAAVISPDPMFYGSEAARPVVAPSGDITVAWLVSFTPSGGFATRRIQAARYSGGAWSAPAELPNQTGFGYGPPAIDVDSGGNVHVVWSQSLASPGIRVLASRYSVATDHWTTVTNLSAVDQQAYNPSVAIDGSGNAIALWFQTASGFSVPQALRWTATLAPPVVSSGSPTSGAITLALQMPTSTDPALAATNIESSIDDGVTWTARSPADASAPLTISGLVDGTRYRVRLRTVNAAGPGRASATVTLRSGLSVEPGDLRIVSRAGNLVTLAWTPPPAGIEPDAYQLEGSPAGQWQLLAVVPTGGAATQFTIAVPDGTFQVRVRGVGAVGQFGASAARLIAVNATTTPTPPASLLGSASGSALGLSWRNTWEYAVPTGIRLTVSGALAGTVDLPLGESFSFPSVPPGTYTFAVSALNGADASAPGSPPVTLTFPGTCSGTPLPPAAFSASTQGGVAYLDWLPPASGEAVTSYVVSVTGAFTGSFPMATRTLAAPVPPGSYTLRVQSIGLCGTSAFTPPQTIVVQ